MTEVRKRVQKELRFRSMTARPDAVKYLESTILADADPDAALTVLMEHLQARVGAGKPVELATAQQLVYDIQNQKEVSSGDDSFAVVDAFDVPYFRYNGVRRNFYRMERPPRVQPQQYVRVLRDRYELIHQRLLRRKEFRSRHSGLDLAAVSNSSKNKRVVGGKQRDTHIEISQIESLVVGSSSKVILGILTQGLDDGSYHLEDLNGSVKLDLSETEFFNGFITEGCVLLAEGVLQEDCDVTSTTTKVFRPSRITLPKYEERSETLDAHSGMDFVQGRGAVSKEQLEELLELEASNESASIVFLSDVHLDNPKVLRKLEKLFEGCMGMNQAPLAFVLMGNFASCPIGDGDDQCSAKAYCESFEKLQAVMLKFPDLLRKSHFIFVPGPSDLGEVAVLPRARLPSALTQSWLAQLHKHVPEARVTFASNPCRIKYLSQELVIFRNDTMSKMRRHSLNEPKDDLSIPEHLLTTMLCQSHLCPLPFQIMPIAWAHDAALRLYPAPQLLVTGDRYDQFSISQGESAMINPGSFYMDGSFIFYVPAHQISEFSRVVDDSDEDPAGISDSEEDDEEEEEEEEDKEMH